MIPQQPVECGFEKEIRDLERRVGLLQMDLLSLQIASEDQRKRDAEVANKRFVHVVVQEEKQLDELLYKTENFHESLSQKMESSMEELRCTMYHLQDETERKQDTIRKTNEGIWQELGSIKSCVDDFTQKQKDELEKFKSIQETSSKHVLKELKSLQEEFRKREDDQKNSKTILKEIKLLMEKNEKKRETDATRSHEQEIISLKGLVEGLTQTTKELSKKLERLQEKHEVNSKQNAGFPGHKVPEKQDWELNKGIVQEKAKNGPNGKGNKKAKLTRTRSNKY